MRLNMRQVGYAVAAAAAMSLVGCSSRADVVGKVTWMGEPVAGTVVLVYADGVEMMSPTHDDGEYAIPNARGGEEVKVVVRGRHTGGEAGLLDAAGDPPVIPETDAAGVGVAPPDVYGSADTTPLTRAIRRGRQRLDVELSR